METAGVSVSLLPTCHSDTHLSHGPRGQVPSCLFHSERELEYFPRGTNTSGSRPRDGHGCHRPRLGWPADHGKPHSLNAQVGKFGTRGREVLPKPHAVSGQAGPRTTACQCLSSSALIGDHGSLLCVSSRIARLANGRSCPAHVPKSPDTSSVSDAGTPRVLRIDQERGGVLLGP